MKKSTNELLKNVLNKNMAGVYKITRKSDGMIYIGQTSNSIESRLLQHINNIHVDEYSDSIDAAIKREGADKFTYETVVALPEATTEQLWFLEALKIEEYDSYNRGFNKTKGNHKGAYEALDSRNKHKVTFAITKIIEKNFRLDFEEKRVLLIGNFNRKFVNYIEYQEANVTTIDAYETEDFIGKFNEVMDSMENKDFDIIISNPPYGPTGVEVTKRIIDEINYKEFVNLLPANDYIKRGKKYNLWQYVENVKNMIPVRSFEDAAVTTHIAKIQKQPNLFLSADEFEIENYVDPSLNKFFYENKDREHYAIDKAQHQLSFSGKTVEDFTHITPYNSFTLHVRDINHAHMPYSKNCTSYKWNVEKSIDIKYIFDNHSAGNQPHLTYGFIIFNSNEEKDNFTNFIYSKNGFRFISKLWTAIHTDSAILLKKAFPKVDWSREWTVEEILKDYGYTDKEIKEVMDDLKNFKGMNA